MRIGGDEFAVIMMDKDEAAWDAICRKIAALHVGFAKTFATEMPLTISAGICFSEDGVLGEAAKRADEALYNTKKRGRAGCTLIALDGSVEKYWKDQNIGYNLLCVMEKHQLRPWKLEISKDGTRSLMGQRALVTCLNLPITASMEEVYTLWHQQIPKESYADVEKMIDDMEQGNATELTIMWNHPQDGSIKVRFGGSKIMNEFCNEKEIYEGYYQVLKDICVL